MANTNCCGGTTTTTCDSTIAELPRYYPRQLITPDDLTLEQNYFRDRMRRHNRLLHGWGVVCGATVCPVTTTNSDGTVSFTPWQVKVQKGYILGPYGDEIILDCCRTVDLRTSGCSGVTGQPCIDAPDPWCSQVFIPPTTTGLLYIAVQYKQCMMRPVRVQPVGCGCNDNTCEYSRWHDGYEIGVLQTCPSCNACDPNVTAALTAATASSLITGGVPSCPDCSCGPWVCLAEVTLSADGSGTIQQINNCLCRRMVVSLCNSWWSPQCAGSSTTVTGVVPTNPATAAANPVPQVPADGATTVQITVNGTNLEIGANVATGPQVIYSFGAGITVSVSGQTGVLQTGQDSVNLTVEAQTNVQPGPYNLTIVNADCGVVIVPNAIQVVLAPGSGSVGSGGGGGGAGGSAKQSPEQKAAATGKGASGADKAAAAKRAKS
ncbi:MAG TPA: hypothetical protein VEE85_00155 [Candidatus Bathyarchaeia archaeon]|nr:hypothetical protein [Candidatus Bathyarchaeia archaeon]